MVFIFTLYLLPPHLPVPHFVSAFFSLSPPHLASAAFSFELPHLLWSLVFASLLPPHLPVPHFASASAAIAIGAAINEAPRTSAAISLRVILNPFVFNYKGYYRAVKK
jgi:hypothetical protein